MAKLRYRVVDVFTETRLEGNPLAVFPDMGELAEPLSDRLMQKIAQEMNLSETVFVLPPARTDCIAKLRIFTPAQEVDFAGHPTVGTAWILLDERRAPATGFALEENVGPVPVRVSGPQDGDWIWLATPPISFGAEFSRQECAEALGLELSDVLDTPPQLVSAGNPNIYVALRSREAVDRAWLDRSSMERLNRNHAVSASLFVFTPEPGGAYSRMFAPAHGIEEDPATGSATGPLGAYMAKHGLCEGSPGTRLISEQGVKMGRRSLLHILFTEETVEVGGNVVPVMEGVLEL